MVGIVDVNGNPIKVETLRESQTSRVAMLNREFASHPSRGLTPAQLARIMEEAELGDMRAQHDLFLDMEEKDAHIYAELSKRKRALLTVDWDIVPPRNASSTEKKMAAYAKEMIEDIPNFDDVILDALDAIGHGYSCQEITWTQLGSEWFPEKFEGRPQSWFQMDYETRTQIRLRDTTFDGAELWTFGWLTHVHKAKSGYISRSGLHRVLAWPYLLKNYALGDLAEFLEIYGLPVRLGKYPTGSSDEEKNTLLSALRSIGHNAAGIMPADMAIEFQNAAQGSEKPFESMLGYCDRAQSKAILGGTLTSQADGKSSTHALGNVHNEVRHDLTVSDARQLGGTLTRGLVFPILALNKGGIIDIRRCPRFEFNVEEGEDIQTLSEALPKLVGVGVRVPRNWPNERLGIPIPADGEETLSAPTAATPPAATQPQGLAANSLASGGKTGADAIDQLVVDALADWQPDIEGAANVVQALMDEAQANGETAEQLLRRIDGLLNAGGPLPLDGKLTKAAFMSALAAFAGVSQEGE